MHGEFIRGLSDTDMREKILPEGDIIFEETVEKIETLDACKLGNQTLPWEKSF